ncbi:MAG: 4-(cytidine 5'-diphospho)-2-C-methyl-D-erythritol kinase [Verrucomicrobiales bacterium]|nr:4-(cytidine 5'-diphospho)-2-C-methyl-D-erythritol kinase [Verrucomicrobiales bacterium]
MNKIEISAPAKTNLHLQILHQREDGFHAIDTRMVALSLADRLILERNKPGSGAVLTCSEAGLDTGEGNLVMRALRVLEEHGGRSFDVSLHLQKEIPIAAGLGGGSSDAAALMMGLNDLFALNLDVPTLASLAARIGSDVPFFVYSSPCDCTGRGEVVTPIEFEIRLPMLLVKPDFGVSAAWAYQNRKGSLENPSVSYAPQLCEWGAMANDLERPVYEKYVWLARLKMWLLDQAETHVAMLSGSGSTMLVILQEEAGGESLQARVQQHFGENVWTYVGHTLASK